MKSKQNTTRQTEKQEKNTANRASITDKKLGGPNRPAE
ncbi:spore protein [Alkalihalobacillus sp. FSL R5-0424]